jgi:translation initiation factor IF-3
MSLLQQPQQQQRSLSSRQRQQQSNNKKKDSGLLANERLIKVLMKNTTKAAGDLMVRLVIDEGKDLPSTVEVVSLTEAIEISLDRDTDLIGTSLNTDPPVLRATQLSKLEYKKKQAEAKNNKVTKLKKSFRFRAGIDDHDLERKAGVMISYLQKGLECEYTIFTKARMLRVNANAGMELVEKIQELVADCGQLKKAPSLNEQGNHLRVQLEPIRGKG